MQIGYDAPAIDEPMEARLNLTPRYLETFGGVAPPEADPASFRAYATAQADTKDETGPGAAR